MKAATPPPLPPLPPELRPAKAPDPRLNAWRSDLAAKELEGLVDAKRFVTGRPRQVAWPLVPMRRQPVPSASLDTELLFGEPVNVYDEAEGWAWIQSQRDRYVGYVPAAALQDQAFKPTHSVSALGTFVYPIPDIKAPPLSHLSLGCQLAVEAQQDRFCRSGVRRLRRRAPRFGARSAGPRFRRDRRTLRRHALSVGRTLPARARLLGIAAAELAGCRAQCPPRQRHAGSSARA